MVFSPITALALISLKVFERTFYSNLSLIGQTETFIPASSLLSKNNMNVNENQIPLELMQPDISSQIKQTTLEELKNWIKDGTLQPHHQIRVKNLNWIEARKFPALLPHFESKTNNQTEQLNQFYSQPLPDISVSEKIESEIKQAKPLDEEKPLSTADTSVKNKSKPAEPSAVFKAFEKKALERSKPTEWKTNKVKASPKRSKKSLILKQAVGFLAGCILAFLLSFGGSYFWVYQLKTPVEIDLKSLPELAKLEDKLTSDKLDLRLKEAAKEQELKNAGNQESPLQQSNISQKVAQLEKQFDAQSKTVLENHRNKLKDVDFSTTFSFSLAVLLALFLLARIFYGKTSQPAGNQHSLKSPKLQPTEPLTIPATKIQYLDVEFSENPDTTKSETAQDENSENPRPIKHSNKSENSDEIIYDTEDSDIEESQTSKCMLHWDKASEFVCETCNCHFCTACLKTYDNVENCCPICKVVCKSLKEEPNKTSTGESVAGEKKKTNLLDTGKDSNFIVYDYPDERTGKIGIIPAFIIAALFSTAISIFWVQKISPFLENRKEEMSQNSSPNETKNSEQATNKNVEISDAPTDNTEGNPSANEPCIDPETRQPFECDEETRRALYEHTKKVKSVEKAQKAAAEKTGLISGLTSSSENSSTVNVNQENPQISVAENAQKEFEKQQMIKTFAISFVIIFGLLMLSRFFSKDKNTEETASENQISKSLS